MATAEKYLFSEAHSSNFVFEKDPYIWMDFCFKFYEVITTGIVLF